MVTLHTLFRLGTYEADRNDSIKNSENRFLVRGDLSQLRPHFDEKRSIAIGYGMDLLTNSITTVNDFLDRTGVPPLSQHDIGLIITARTIVAQTPSNQSLPSQSVTALKGLAQQFDLALPNEVTAENILKLDLEAREARLDAFLLRNGITVEPSLERVALMSLYFNSRPTFQNNVEVRNNLLGPNLLDALRTGNRAEAWFEIRYDSNKERTTDRSVAHGIAERRYAESDMFGLAESGSLSESQALTHALNVLRMVKDHQQQIWTYEGDSRTRPDSTLSAFLQPEYFHAAQVVSQQMASTSIYGPKEILLASTPFGGDPIQGTDASELLLGDISHDILIGGGGDDLLRGEGGHDVYVYNSGDGNDTILDTDGQGHVVFDHHLLRVTGS